MALLSFATAPDFISFVEGTSVPAYSLCGGGEHLAKLEIRSCQFTLNLIS